LVYNIMACEKNLGVSYMCEGSQTEAKSEKKTTRFRRERCTVCGSLVLRLNRSRHCKTKKHLDANYVQHELFELLLPVNSAP
jgi:hypothetical protein